MKRLLKRVFICPFAGHDYHMRRSRIRSFFCQRCGKYDPSLIREPIEPRSKQR